MNHDHQLLRAFERIATSYLGIPYKSYGVSASIRLLPAEWAEHDAPRLTVLPSPIPGEWRVIDDHETDVTHLFLAEYERLAEQGELAYAS